MERLTLLTTTVGRLYSDSLVFFRMKCSTLQRWMILCAPLVFTACATIGPPQPPSLDLPTPPIDLRASRKGDHVTLTWTVPSVTTDRQTTHDVGSTRICRSLAAQLAQCGTPAGEMKPAPRQAKPSDQKVPASYSDTLPAEMESDTPAEMATYAVEVLNHEGRGAGLSNQVRVSTVRTLPPPQDFQARVTGQGVVLTWTSAVPPEKLEDGLRHFVRIFRLPEGGQRQVVATQAATGGAQSFTDSGIEWEKTYEYHAETVTVIDQQNMLEVEGDETPSLKVFADDVFPPSVPSNLQAVFSGPGQKAFIDLVWAPVSDADLAGYNVYRNEDGAQPVKLNSDPVKSPAYRDESVTPGKRYFYSVSSIDGRGNESGRSEDASESVPQ